MGCLSIFATAPKGCMPVMLTLDPTCPSALSKCNGYDIIKKSSTRKNRYLVVINAQLAPAAAGRLGTLSQLDTKNPVLYVDFPQARRGR